MEIEIDRKSFIEHYFYVAHLSFRFRFIIIITFLSSPPRKRSVHCKLVVHYKAKQITSCMCGVYPNTHTYLYRGTRGMKNEHL